MDDVCDNVVSSFVLPRVISSSSLRAKHGREFEFDYNDDDGDGDWGWGFFWLRFPGSRSYGVREWIHLLMDVCKYIHTPISERRRRRGRGGLLTDRVDGWMNWGWILAKGRRHPNIIIRYSDPLILGLLWPSSDLGSSSTFFFACVGVPFLAFRRIQERKVSS